MNYQDFLSQTTNEEIISVDTPKCPCEIENQPVDEPIIMPRATPVIPLPNPGEGGPVFSGNSNGNGSNGAGGSNGSGNNDSGATPVIPLPNPGEGGPVFPGLSLGDSILGTLITVLPRPVTPCFYCNSNSYGTLRFLNAAVGYNPFIININNRTAVDALAYAEISEYGRVSSGYQTISITGSNGYVYVSKQIRVTTGSRSTIAVINTSTGLDFLEINDVACYAPYHTSCVRACNLSYNSGPLHVVSYSGAITFGNISYKETTDYIQATPARYDMYVANSRQVLLSTELTVRANSQYTIYLFNWNTSPTAIRTLIVEDRK